MIFDIDYRPNLWGLAGHGAGEERYIRSEKVSRHLQAILPDCDLIVGTEEEIHIAAGEEDTLAALAKIRSLSQAAIVLKRGPMGCVVFAGAIPARLEDGIVGEGFPIEVYNVLGAGDAFLSGFLRGYLKGEPHADLGDVGQRLRRLRGVAALVLAGNPDLGRACSISSPTAVATAPCARMKR